MTQKSLFVNLVMLSYIGIFTYIFGAVYTVQVFGKLLSSLSFSLTAWQQPAAARETAIFWNWAQECKIMKLQPSFRLCKLAQRKACESSG